MSGLSERERRVCERIAAREAALLADLRVHVELPTGGRNVVALDHTRQVLTERLRRLGASIEHVAGVERPEWLYGEAHAGSPLPVVVCRRSGVGREMLLSGHLDTVHDPAGAFQKLTIAPDGTTAIGPGCVDMKGGLVIAFAALEALEECGEQVCWSFVLNSDEETGSYHSAPAITAEAARVARTGGVGLALEPAAANNGLVIERAGSAQFMIEVRGVAAHVGRDFGKGVSAVYELCQTVLGVRRIGEQIPGIVVNVGPMHGGDATNVVPAFARAWGNVRFGTPEHMVRFEQAFRALVGERTGGARVDVRLNVGRPPKPATADVMQMAEIVQLAAADLGQTIEFARTAGVCDGNLMQAAGLPTLDTLGVVGGGLHTPDEWIEIPSLVRRCQLLAVTMLRLGAHAR